jgi:hypothetical protein
MRKLLLASVATMGATLVMTGGAKAQPVKPVAPGTVVVHVNGYLQFEIAGFGSSVNTHDGDKLNPISTDGDARLYAGFDAQSLSGLDYGAQLEVRTTTSDAGVGAEKVSGSGSAAGTEGLYIKRAYGYLGAPTSGFVRIGQGDSAFTLLQSGVVEAFGDGAQFNTDGGVESLLPTEATPQNFIYADASNLYATDKLVYLSPAIAGFSAGFGYEPNSNGLKEGYSTNAEASSTSAALSSSTAVGDIGKRRKNTVDAAIQYKLETDGIVAKASGGILYGAPINYVGAPIAFGAGTNHFGYDNLEVYQAGAQVTVAGLTVGANVKGGQVEDSYYFKPKGARDALSFILGASYVVGPIVIGGSVFQAQSAGTYYPGETYTVGKTKQPVGKTLTEFGAAAGGNYVISPNLSLFVQYLYGHKQQIGNSGLVNGREKGGAGNCHPFFLTERSASWRDLPLRLNSQQFRVWRLSFAYNS